MDDFTESEVQQRWRSVVLEFQKVPLQAFLSVPAESASVICFNVKVESKAMPKTIWVTIKRMG